MTRAFLRWAVLMATLGSALAMAVTAQAQICTDYYRFDPINSNVCPYTDGCMEEEYGEEFTPTTEPVATNASHEDLDLSGRSVVAIIDDPAEDATSDCQDDCGSAAEEPMVVATQTEQQAAVDLEANEDSNEDSSDEYPHYGYYENYYGYYDYSSEYPCDEESAEEVVATDATLDTCNEADAGHAYDDGSLYGGPCNPENNTHPEENASETSGEQVADIVADEPDACEQPFDAYDYDGVYDDCYEAPCQQDFESAAPAEQVETNEAPVECYDYELHRALMDAQESVASETAKSVDPPLDSTPATDTDEFHSYYDDYDYSYDYDTNEDCEEESAMDDSSDPVVTEAVDQNVAEVEVDDSYDYDADYGYEYDDSYRYDANENCEEESTMDDSSDAIVTEAAEQDVDQAEADDAYDYDAGYGYEEYDGCEEESAVDDSSDAINSEPVEQTADEADMSASETYDYDTYDYDEYDYESHAYGDQDDSVTQSSDESEDSQQNDAEEESADATSESAIEYDTQEVYEYDYYEPYDASPADDGTLEDDMADESSSIESNDSYEQDSYEVYDYDTESVVDDAEAAADVDTSSANEQPTEAADQPVDQQYYGRYPYGYGYEYDYEYDSNEAVEPDNASDGDVSAQVEFDIEQFVELGRQAVRFLTDAEFAQAIQAPISGLRTRVNRVLSQVDMEQLQETVSHSVVAMLQSQDPEVDLLDGSVFLFEFELEGTVDMTSPISLDETPWMIEEQQVVGELSAGTDEATAAEPMNAEPVSVLPNTTRNLAIQWVNIATSTAKTAWDALAPELERIAAETLARASLVEPVTTQR